MEAMIVFAIIFVPFFWFIWVALRFTRDTIGTNSPLKVRRTYKITAWGYFTNFDYLFSYYLLMMGSLMCRMAFTVHMAPASLIRFSDVCLYYALAF